MSLYSVSTGNLVQAQDVTQFVQLLTGSMSDQQVTITNRIRAQTTGANAGSGGYVGQTSTGPPTTGTWNVGDFVVDGPGMVWTCVTPGAPAPGRWRAAGPVICTSSSRPSGVALYNGLGINEIDTGLTYTYTGAKWIRDEVTLVKTASQAVTSSSLVPDTVLKFTGDANSVYQFEINYHFTAFPTPKFTLGFTFPSGVRLDLTRLSVNGSGVTYFEYVPNILTSGWGTTGYPDVNGYGGYRMAGAVQFGASGGTFSAVIGQFSTDNAHPSYGLPGSWLQYRQTA